MGSWAGVLTCDEVSVIKIYRRYSPRIGAMYPHPGVVSERKQISREGKRIKRSFTRPDANARIRPAIIRTSVIGWRLSRCAGRSVIRDANKSISPPVVIINDFAARRRGDNGILGGYAGT